MSDLATQTLHLAVRWLGLADLPACVLPHQTAADIALLPPEKRVLAACALDVLRLAAQSPQGRQAVTDMGLPGLFGHGDNGESARLADEVAALRQLMERATCNGSAMRAEFLKA